MEMPKALAIWLVFIPLGVLNGWFREAILSPVTGPYALPLSGLSLSLLILAVSIGLIPLLKKQGSGFHIAVGLFWVGLTISFEFFFGLVVLGRSLGDLFSAYNPATGNLWLLVLMVIGVAPIAAARIRRRICYFLNEFYRFYGRT